MANTKDPSFLDRCFKDANGKPTLMQAPNLPIVVWFGALLLTKITSGRLEHFFDLISFGAIFTWAWLEIFKGDSYFRRALGALVMIFIIWNRL